MIEQVMTWIVRAVGNAAMIPLSLLTVAALYVLVGVDVTNFSISVATLLLVTVLQHASNRDGLAIQVKLDALIEASDARNDLIGLDKKTEKEIERERE